MSSFVVRGAAEVDAMLGSGRVGAGGWSGLGNGEDRRSARCGGPGRSPGSGLAVLADKNEEEGAFQSFRI